MTTLIATGYPPFATSFRGIDVIGCDCRISQTVTIFREVNFYPSAQIRLGSGVVLFEHVRFLLGAIDARIELGDRVTVNCGSYISGEGGLLIGSDVLIGPHVRLLSAGHVIDGGDEIISKNPISYGAIRIDSGAWIAAGATVLPGVHVGRGSVVGAGAVVTADVPEFAVVAGNPAKIIRYRKGCDTSLSAQVCSA